MGTMLQEQGLRPGDCPELFGLEHPEVLEEIHGAYLEAGADIIQTNTFGANRFKLAEYGLEERVKEINTAAVRIARKAVGGRALVALDVGPTGRLLEPMGDATFDTLYEAFCEQVRAGAAAGADLISIETMTDIGELRAAVIAARENTSLPIIAHLTFEHDGRTMMGTDPATAAIILEALGVAAMGANCSGGAPELLPVIEEMAGVTSLFLSVEPNAGLPRLEGECTVFPDTPEMMAQYAVQLREAGANIIGGCCGTTPTHIRAMAEALKGMPPPNRRVQPWRALASRSRLVMITGQNPNVFIGERINPTARKKLSQEIKAGRMGMVVDEARKQVAAGAPILDVNMGVPGIDESAVMRRAVLEIQTSLDVPLSIDSTDPEVVEEALKVFVGRPLINSTTGEARAMERILPLARKYGAAVLGLCLDETGIPARAEGRLEIGRRIRDTAREYGLRDEDIYIDCLVQTASAEQGQVMETIRCLGMIKEQLGLGTVLGISNVSHGLPARELLNSTYLAMAWLAGLDLPIINPFDSRIRETNRAAAVLLNQDPRSARYIEEFRDWSTAERVGKERSWVCQQCNIPDLLSAAAPTQPPITEGNSSPSLGGEAGPENADLGIHSQIRQAVIKGEKEKLSELIREALKAGEKPEDLLNLALIPGIEEVGELYDKKQYFLPQLMQSAETMKDGVEMIKPFLSSGDVESQGVIVLGTVEGDIHDIGKNILSVFLENHGFRIIDLGKDVPARRFVDEAIKHQADIVGLSALMTTTMPRMPEVIQELKKAGVQTRVMVGGAVLNQEYAEQIGADAYAADAREAVIAAKSLLGK